MSNTVCDPRGSASLSKLVRWLCEPPLWNLSTGKFGRNLGRHKNGPRSFLSPCSRRVLGLHLILVSADLKELVALRFARAGFGELFANYKF